MKKNFGQQTWMYPMPVLIVCAYDKDGNANALNAAWGSIYDYKQIMICLDHSHKTTQNIKDTKAFTVSFANVKYLNQCDYLGIVSGNEVPNKIKQAGFSVEKSKFVNAPIITELPMVLECKLIKFDDNGNLIGEIVNVGAEETILDSKGNIDPSKLQLISYDPINHTYLEIGKKVGTAFEDGKKLLK